MFFKKRATYLALSVLLSGPMGYGFQKVQKFSLGDPKATARLADQNRELKMTLLEHQTKSDHIYKKIKDPVKYEELKDNPGNPDLLLSYLREIDEAMKGKQLSPKKSPKHTRLDYYREYMQGSQIDLARKIAKYEMYQMVKRNWKRLEETVFNDGRPLRDRLNETLLFSKEYSNKDKYVFTFEGQSFVEIDRKNLRSGRVALDINSQYDSNKLQPGVDQIKTAEDSGVADSSHVPPPVEEEAAPPAPPAGKHAPPQPPPKLPPVDESDLYK